MTHTAHISLLFVPEAFHFRFSGFLTCFLLFWGGLKKTAGRVVEGLLSLRSGGNIIMDRLHELAQLITNPITNTWGDQTGGLISRIVKERFFPFPSEDFDLTVGNRVETQDAVFEECLESARRTRSFYKAQTATALNKKTGLSSGAVKIRVGINNYICGRWSILMPTPQLTLRFPLGGRYQESAVVENGEFLEATHRVHKPSLKRFAGACPALIQHVNRFSGILHPDAARLSSNGYMSKYTVSKLDEACWNVVREIWDSIDFPYENPEDVLSDVTIARAALLRLQGYALACNSVDGDYLSDADAIGDGKFSGVGFGFCNDNKFDGDPANDIAIAEPPMGTDPFVVKDGSGNVIRKATLEESWNLQTYAFALGESGVRVYHNPIAYFADYGLAYVAANPGVLELEDYIATLLGILAPLSERVLLRQMDTFQMLDAVAEQLS
jgi:hypothetical protein